MTKLFESYLAYLAAHPGRVDSIILWTVTMMMVWFMLFRYRNLMMRGMSGTNGLFEAAEQVAYISHWIWPPIVCYSAFFNVELSAWVWYFVIGVIAYTLGGRWLFEWVLALRAGKSSVESSQTTKDTTNI